MAEYKGRNPRNPKYQQQSGGFSEADVVEGIFRGIGQVFTAIWNALRGGKPSSGAREAARARIREGWEQVEMHLMQEATAALAVSEADKLVDAALKASGVRGETMGERLRNAQKLLPGDVYQQVWEAHKVRNSLAHEIGMKVTREEAAWVVGIFRKALYQLGIL